MRLNELSTTTEFVFTGDIVIDHKLQPHWDSHELDEFMDLLHEHGIKDFAVIQTYNEVMQREITVRVSVDAISQEFEYDLTTIMLRHHER